MHIGSKVFLQGQGYGTVIGLNDTEAKVRFKAPVEGSSSTDFWILKTALKVVDETSKNINTRVRR